jgi:hypothetical protein
VFSKTLVTNWLQDGVSIAVDLYIKKMSKSETILILRGIRHTDGKRNYPMFMEIWENSTIQKVIPLFFPLEVLAKYTSINDTQLQFHVHHFYNLESSINQLLLNSKYTFYFYIHDYYLFTKYWHLYDPSEEKILSLDQAHEAHPNELIKLGAFINKVQLFICPSKQVYDNCITFIPKNKLHWVYHPELPNIELIKPLKSTKKESEKVLVIGNLGPSKGSYLVQAILKELEKLDSNLQIIHIGRGAIAPKSKNYENYVFQDRDQVLKFCLLYEFKFAFLPFNSPETYSFALSDVFILKLPLLTTDIGAIKERCAFRDYTHLLSINTPLKDYLNFFVSDKILEKSDFSKKDNDAFEVRSRSKEYYYFLD